MLECLKCKSTVLIRADRFEGPSPALLPSGVMGWFYCPICSSLFVLVREGHEDKLKPFKLENTHE
ncbi:MAG: hypothetical protein DRI01_03540 [Chloroflexi bacterium]|nr:MAG: hypothetical protein DRI01_03540 [Chloroflexota bacterium]